MSNTQITPKTKVAGVKPRKDTNMKKILLPALITATCLFGTPNAMADSSLVGVYTTGEHNILITQISSERYKYQVWNLPKDIGDGYPDWTMTNGYEVGDPAFGCTETACSVPLDSIEFDKGNTTFLITEVRYEDGVPFAWHELYKGKRRPPNGADADLTIYVNRKEKQHYWLYRR